jgi:hypothetical protein
MANIAVTIPMPIASTDTIAKAAPGRARIERSV